MNYVSRKEVYCELSSVDGGEKVNLVPRFEANFCVSFDEGGTIPQLSEI